jgi:adenylate kinase
VGKTRLLESVAPRFPAARVWRASEIIGDMRHLHDPERLRTLPRDEIERSQHLLIQGFALRRQQYPQALVFLDAHSVIDTDDLLVDIPVKIAEALAPTGIVHISDEVERIQERRLADAARARPARTLRQLEEYQRRSLAACERFATAVNVLLLDVRSGDTAALTEAIVRMLPA